MARTVIDALLALLHVISETINESISIDCEGSKICTESVKIHEFASETVNV